MIKENGFDYDAKAKIGNFDFPTKNYQDISFPAGKYDALRINIGNSDRSKLVVRFISISLLYR